jgi:hypothetical protein
MELTKSPMSAIRLEGRPASFCYRTEPPDAKRGLLAIALARPSLPAKGFLAEKALARANNFTVMGPIPIRPGLREAPRNARAQGDFFLECI